MKNIDDDYNYIYDAKNVDLLMQMIMQLIEMLMITATVTIILLSSSSGLAGKSRGHHDYLHQHLISHQMKINICLFDLSEFDISDNLE